MERREDLLDADHPQPITPPPEERGDPRVGPQRLTRLGQQRAAGETGPRRRVDGVPDEGLAAQVWVPDRPEEAQSLREARGSDPVQGRDERRGCRPEGQPQEAGGAANG